MCDAREKVNEIENTLYNNPPEANSPERKKMIEDLIFYRCIEHIGYRENDYNDQDRTDQISDRMLENLGIEILDGQHPLYEDSIKGQLGYSKEFQEEKNKLSAAYQAHHISDIQMILARPDGEETLRKYYQDAIRKSDTYKDLVEAEGDEIFDEVDALGYHDFKRDYPNVKIPNVSKEYNKQQEEAYNQKVNQIEKNITNIVLKSELLYKEDEKDYGIRSLGKEDMRKNAKIVADMYKTLTDNDDWYKKSSEQFKDLKKEMKNLKEMAEKMAKSGKEPTDKELAEYEKKAREVNALTEKYIDYKKVTDGDYAERRLKAVQNLRRHLGANLKSILTASEKRFEKQQQDLQDEMNKEFKENKKLKEQADDMQAVKEGVDPEFDLMAAENTVKREHYKKQLMEVSRLASAYLVYKGSPKQGLEEQRVSIVKEIKDEAEEQLAAIELMEKKREALERKNIEACLLAEKEEEEFMRMVSQTLSITLEMPR